ncbi:MAG TPA: NAD(P)-dependent oxidoreductase [Acidimicrobiales bacterium]|nr:NAD(P)-dependent oxidoreductase [Acidimicrobiales bacterium]
MLEGQKVLVAGASGQVARPLTLALAGHNEVWATARFRDLAARRTLEAAGVTCVAVDLVDGDLGGLPRDFGYVLNFSVMKTNDWGRDLDGNAGAVAALMHHCRGMRAFLHCSSTAVYQPDGHRAFAETDPLGDNHRVWRFMETYSIAKIAAEAMARSLARQLGIPTTIARLSVPYGDSGGWPAIHVDMIRGGVPIPVHRDAPSVYNPIHDDDIVAMVPAMLGAAAVPATIVNWGGEDAVSIEEWCAHLGELTGQQATFQPTDQTIGSVSVDLTRMHELVGHARVPWRDGFARMVAARPAGASRSSG